MRQSRHPIHVGIWINIAENEQGILHCVKHAGVIFQDLHSLQALGWKIAGYYRFKG